MKSIIYAVSALLLFSSAGVVIEQKLGQFNTVGLALLFVLPFIPLALFFLLMEKLTGRAVSFPDGGLLYLTIFLGALYFVADYFYIGAFNAGGDVMTISTILMLAPVATAVAKHFWVGGYPNAYQIIGYLAAAVAVFLIAKGATATLPS
jgi:hypothetical protein